MRVKLFMTISIVVLQSALVASAYSEGLYSEALYAEELVKQRQLYTQARQALEDDNIARYNDLKQKLSNYPLIVYLDYQEIKRQLDDYPYQKVDEFLDKHQYSYLGQLLLKHWLNQLASRQRWHEYRSYYDANLNSSAHRCLFLWSRFKTGDHKSLEEVGALWNVGKSRPNQCNGLFKQWRKEGYLTNDILWSRYQKALVRNNTRLGRYLKTQMPKSTQAFATLFQKTLKDPSLLEKQANYSKTHPYFQHIVYNGLKRYARSKPDRAWKLWHKYESIHDFSDSQKSAFYYTLSRQYAFREKETDVLRLLNTLSEKNRIRIIGITIRKQLKKQHWQAVLEWIKRLPDNEQQNHRWQYWQARVHQLSDKPVETYQPVYKELAKQRNFYGFLSADHLDIAYNLQNTPTNVEQELLFSLKNTPAFERARELFILGKLNDARREWRNAITQFSPSEYQAAALLAHKWGWHRKSIESMAAAKTWNDLAIRFPVAHEEIINEQAAETQLPATLIYAIARQESAWESDARSSAGAMGLMQLLPATAKETASKAGIKHSKSDLFLPQHNIALGSRYIGELLQQFDNNRVPAIAAYNAGPGRVNRWLKNSERQLAHDIWIEVIPFNETRKYVQNVLSYAVIYSHHTGQPAPLLTQLEAKELL